MPRPRDAAAVVALIDALDGGQVDAIAFTSASQVDRLFQVAVGAGAEARLRAALARACVAAIGPIVVEALGGAASASTSSRRRGS